MLFACAWNLALHFLVDQMPGGRVAVDTLLRASLVHVPALGFSRASVRKTLMDRANMVEGIPISDVDRALSVMFPGSDTAPMSAPRRLFQVWDADASLRAFGKNCVPSDVNPKKDAALEATLSLLRSRLAKSAEVREHLLPVSE